jgi:hypothetical protein
MNLGCIRKWLTKSNHNKSHITVFYINKSHFTFNFLNLLLFFNTFLTYINKTQLEISHLELH